MAGSPPAADVAKTETEILLLCARAGLDPAGVAELRGLVRKSLDWTVLLKMADFNGLFPLLYWHLNQSAADLVPAEQLDIFRYWYQKRVEHVLSLTAELIKILSLLEEHKIVAVPYKGPALASRLYGNVGLRQSGDLDILVARKDVAAAQGLLEEQGFRPRYPMSPVARDFILRSRYNVTLDRAGGPTVELHWAFTVPAMGFSLNLEQIKPRLGKLVLGGVQLRDFGSEDLLLILSVHGAKDCWYRLEWLSGVAELIRKEAISWSEVMSRATDLRMERTLLLALVLAHDLLEAPVPGHLIEAARSRSDVMRLAADVRQRARYDAAGWGEPPDSLTQNLFRFRLQQTRRGRLRYLFHQLTTPSREKTRWVVPIGGRPIPLPALIRPFYVIGRLLRRLFSAGVSRVHRTLSALLVAAALVGCGDSTGPVDQPTFEFDFATEAQGWAAGFSDYPVGAEDQIEPEAAHDPLPPEIDREGSGLFIAGTNTPDDLFMFWKRRVTGLAADTRYRVTFEVEFATEAPTGCPGIGGSPGESVFVKAGATAVEPVPVVEDMSGTDYYQMNIDKGEQAQGGEDAVVLGTIGNTNTDCANPVWELKTLTTDTPLEVTTAADGSAWLIVGTESGFEGRTELFYTRIVAEFERI